MTPPQAETYDNQQRPDNQYQIHPLVDGCASRSQPTIRTVEPNQLNRQLGDAEISIIGSNFVHGATASLHGPDVTVEGATVQSSTRIVATLRIRSDTPVGPRDLKVRNPSGSSASSPGAVVIFDKPILH